MADVNELAGVVALAIKAAMGQYQERVAVLESELKSALSLAAGMTELRDRVVAAETKAALLEQRPAPVLESKSIEEPLWKPDMADIRRRLEVLETDPAVSAIDADLTLIKDRVRAVETKAAEPVALPEFITSGRLHLLAEKADRAVDEVTLLAKDVGTMRERVAVVEVRQPVPGPAGKDGKDGTDGMGWDDLSVTHDGERTFSVNLIKGERVKEAGSFKIPIMLYRGVFKDGNTYEPGDAITYGGSMYHCRKTTAIRPDVYPPKDAEGQFAGPKGSDFWTLVVKKGEKGIPISEPQRPQPLPVVSVKG